MMFKAGDKNVRAKWPGSKLWYKATVVEVLEDGYSVKFEDGTEYDVDFSDVASESRFTRRSRSSSKSPSRRRRSRSRSPARRAAPAQKKTPSPARKPVVVRESRSETRKTATVAQPVTVAQSVTRPVLPRPPATKPVEDTPADVREVRSTPRKIITPTTTRTTVHRTYTTRSSTKSGHQVLEPPTDMSFRAVPKTRNYEFGGPIGTFLLIFLLPVVVYYLYMVCNKGSCNLVLYPKWETDWKKYLDFDALCIVIGWIMFQLLIYFIPIGRVVQGLPLRSGRRLRYYENAFYALFLSLLGLGLMKYYKTSFAIVLDKYLALITASLILSVLLSVYLYIRSKYARLSDLAPAGNSGNFFYDFFMGHELNPRIGMLDLKYFFELRPGLIGWVILDYIFLFAAWKDFPSNPPLTLLLLTIFHTLYVADALWFETAILSTMDIITEGFGYMLAFGDIVWVPFVFTVQARYLMLYPVYLPTYSLGIIVAMNLFGYYIFRSANSQKNQFRKNPNSISLAYLETIKTTSGKRLLVSGWWGFVRRPNYLGDIIMAFSWALLCGFDHFLPYFYPLYLTIILIHRERRDSHFCHQKYGSDWDIYCRRVPYRIFPYIY